MDDYGNDQPPRRKPTLEALDAQLKELLGEVRRFHGAFPRTDDGECDLDGHRKYHEALIVAANEQAEFWRDLRRDLAKKGAWSLLLLICGLILTGVMAKLGFATAVGAAATATTVTR